MWNKRRSYCFTITT